MRKIYLFFALLIGISSAAWATDFTPQDGAVYTIRNKKHGTFALYNSGCNNTNGTNILSTWAQFDQRSFFIIEGDATNGYTLRFKNETTRYVFWLNTNGGRDNGNANVGTKVLEGATVPDDCKWKIVENGTGTWNIIPFNGECGWNQRGSIGGNNCVGQWDQNNTDDNRWYIQKPSEMASAAITARGNYDESWSGKIGCPIKDAWTTWQTTVTTAASTLETTFSAANVTTLKNALFSAIALLTPTSGLYKIKNVGTSLYLFQTNEGYPKNITLINDGGDNSKYYWKATFDGNVVSLTGSLGQAPSREGNGAKYSDITSGVVMNTITMKGAPSASASYTEGAFLWPTVHTTKQTAFTVNTTTYNTDTNPYYLTTWDVTDGADQYTFEAVELADGKQIYTVNVDRSVYDCDANVTFNSDSYTGNKTVNNGGFFILTSSEALAENFSAVNINGLPYYPATVSIEGTTINVTYTFDIEKQASYYVANSEANKVGYPTSTCQVVTDLKSALETYQASETAENLSALSTAITAYKNETTDISMPVDGKAYTFKNVAYDSENRWYLKYVNETTGITLTSYAVEATTFVCRKVGDGQYAFVNNDGKYLAWKGGNGTGVNDNKGYVNAYDEAKAHKNGTTYTDWAQLTIQKMLASETNVDGEQADLCGYMLIKGRRYDMDGISCFVIKADGTLDQASAPFFKTSNGTRYSSAFLIEDATYANVVSLKDASTLESGKNIATFSAPFPTVVPENTTAYTVETTSGTNVTKVALQEAVTAGNAIPANEGVILIGTATGNVTMLPRTTEAITNIANNGLSHTAGAAADVNDGNSYVLANKSEGWAFYKVSTAATSQLPMNKAYLHLTAASETIRFDFGNATGIDNIDTDNKAESKIYDLSGRAVKTMSKGLYIVDGKKVIK